MKLPINCFKCNRELEPAIKELPDKQELNQPYAGTSFSSSGHYGSTVFDPMSNIHTLEINICDPCLLEFKDRVAFLRTIKRIPVFEYRNWNPWNYD